MKNLTPIGAGLDRIGTDWQGLANWKICVGKKELTPIGTGLAQIGAGLV